MNRITKWAAFSALVSVLFGVAYSLLLYGDAVGEAPKSRGDRNYSFALPKEFQADEGDEIMWLLFLSYGEGSRKIEVNINDVCVYRNHTIPSSWMSIRYHKTKLAPGHYGLMIKDLTTGQSVSTNFQSGATEQIEIQFSPLRVSVFENAGWIYL